MPQSRDTILSLIPHQGTMCLLDAIVDWDPERIHCRSESHRNADNPLRRAGRLHAIHLAEYGAQAMAVHGGLLSRQHGRHARPGLLVSLRQLQLYRRDLDGLEHPLQVEAELLLDAVASWQYRFQVRHAGEPLADGRAAVMLLPEA